MYIKSVILDGFKSYGHRTEIVGFDQQFNAITGLNGSGKSNILDAICFVLGITNLTHVRVDNLQDLIYKSGQCGINKATVSITFDNSNPNQCPPGFENVPEITITRQIVMGGKHKYLVNGALVQNKKIHDLFCSIQLNVNNPHFLIMQGKITKVLNMKPYDILGMVEESAGTKMFEVKKEGALKTIEKKDAKLRELKTVITEEISPKLEKLRTERAKYMEYKNTERELDHMLKMFQAWEFVYAKRRYLRAQEVLEKEENKLNDVKTDMKNHSNKIKQLDDVIKELTNRAEADSDKNLKKIEDELRTAERSQAKVNAKVESINEEISNEIEKKKQLEKNLKDDGKALKSKESDLEKFESAFLELKEADRKDSEAYALSQKRYEALSTGMELNERGEAESLQKQLMDVREQLSNVNTEKNSALIRLDFCTNQYNTKKNKRTSEANSMLEVQKAHDIASKEVSNFEKELKKLNFDENRMEELQNRRRQLTHEMRGFKDRVDNFEARKPYTQFRYKDPEPNFNKNSVIGVVCRLFQVKNEEANRAIEAVAGGRLYNVVIDTDTTGKKLLNKGDLQRRTTFMPINKLQASRMGNNIIQLAEKLVGKENVQPALDHLNYNKKLQIVMDFIFGEAFICKNVAVAKQIAFHPKIKRRCVTLDGDVIDPAGTLSGGAVQQGASFLAELGAILEAEKQLDVQEQELENIEAEIRELVGKERQFQNLKQKLELKRHELNLIMQRLQQTSHYKQKEEIENLEKEIKNLKEQIASCKEKGKQLEEKVKNLENKISNSKGGIEGQIKEAEKEMKKLKAKADQSQKAWKQKEQDYETLKMEIEELKKSLVNTQQQIVETEENVVKLKQQLEEILANSKEMNDNIAKMQAELKEGKAQIAEKNKDIQRKINEKETHQAEITKCEIKIKELNHELKKLQDECKHLKLRQTDLEKRVKGANLKEAEQLSDEEGQQLEKKIRKAQEMKNSLGRTVNDKAQTHFEQHEKEYTEVKKKQKIVEQDKQKLLQVIQDLDKKKGEILAKAFEQISKDFGSIFKTLLPGADAKLVPPRGQTILQGLEIKVSLGGVWKESLAELSGGQRSLAALSLILAMLLFKPAPLYILDEVDAALDLSHTQNIGHMLKTHFTKSQFIVVSLKDGMFNNANVLFKTQFVDGVSTITRTVNRS